VYLYKKSPTDTEILGEKNNYDATLVESSCGTFDGVAELTVSDLVGTETVVSSGGTATPTVGVGKITFTAGSCWNLVLSSGHSFNFAEGWGTTIYNIGTGADGTLSGATLSTFWGTRQDTYHYNVNNGFDLWENGTVGQEIRTPIGATSISGYTKTGSFTSGKWHNRAETGITFPSYFQTLQDSLPITSITKNAQLRWIDSSSLYEYIIYTSGVGTITQDANGVRIYTPAGDYVSFYRQNTIENGKTYNYYMDLYSLSGSVQLVGGGVTTTFTTAGIKTGSFTATSSSSLEIKRNGVTDAIVKNVFVWEENTIPPLFEKEIELNMNDGDKVFIGSTETKIAPIVIYDTAKTDAEKQKFYKCFIKKLKGEELTGLVYDVNGNLVYDASGNSVEV